MAAAFAGTVLGTVDVLIGLGAGYLSLRTAVAARALGPRTPLQTTRTVADDVIDEVLDRIRRERGDADRRCEEVPLLEGLCRSDDPDPDATRNPDPDDPGQGEYRIGRQDYVDCDAAAGDTLLVERARPCSAAASDWSAIDGGDGPDLGPATVYCGSGVAVRSGTLVRVAVTANLLDQTCDQARASTDVALDVGSDPTP